jgi:hypothetical protein
LKVKTLIGFLFIVLVEGMFAQADLLTMQFDSGRGHIFNYAAVRLGLAGAVFLIQAGWRRESAYG